MIVEANKDIKYVTYFQTGDVFDPSKIVINLDNRHNGCLFKPDRGFWGSPVNARYGWKEWCENEEYGDYDYNNPIYWTLTSGKILQVNWDEVENKETSNLTKYIKPVYVKPVMIGDYCSYSVLDWNKMLKDGIVAVQLMNSIIGKIFKYDLEERFNSWDCESIVVLDKSRLNFI